MKSFFPLLILALFIQVVTGQNPGGDLENISIESFRERIAGSIGGQDIREIVDEVLASGRMDLIACCFESTQTASFLHQKVEAQPDSPTKDRIVIALLRSKSPYFPRIPEPNIADVRQGSIAKWPIESFRSVIKKWLPDEPLEEAIMNSAQARAVLAGKLEAAMDRKPATVRTITDHKP